jgi:hypothetical protein
MVLGLRGSRWLAAAGLVCGVGLVGAGCCSAVSTHVTPDPTGTTWEKKKLEGVPVTVKLPTHLDVRVVERRYFDPKSQAVIQAPGPDARLHDFVTRDVEFSVREKDQVFLVDAVRPAAGQQKLNAEFTGQYFTEYDTYVNDKTIDTITAIIKQFTPGAPAGGAKGTAFTTPDAAKWTQIDRVVAAKVFEFRDVNLEANLMCFLNAYLNDCAVPCAPAVPTSNR